MKPYRILTSDGKQDFGIYTAKTPLHCIQCAQLSEYDDGEPRPYAYIDQRSSIESSTHTVINSKGKETYFHCSDSDGLGGGAENV